MLNIPVSVYEEVADRLREALGMKDYFSGSIEAHDDDYDYRLTATLIVYRRRDGYAGCEFEAIDDLVPVWWEFHSYDMEGELLNDGRTLPFGNNLFTTGLPPGDALHFGPVVFFENS